MLLWDGREQHFPKHGLKSILTKIKNRKKITVHKVCAYTHIYTQLHTYITDIHMTDYMYIELWCNL